MQNGLWVWLWDWFTHADARLSETANKMPTAVKAGSPEFRSCESQEQLRAKRQKSHLHSWTSSLS